MITRKALSRRTVLRGLGTAVALPFLDAMSPAFGAARRVSSEAAPTRLAFVYVPNGVIMEQWTPAGEGRQFELSRILKPVEKYRDQTLLLSGLTHNNGRALGDGPGDHARAASSYLTGMHPKKTAGADIRIGVSVDQLIAQEIGQQTRFASLELGTEPGRLAGNCDSGYSCAYSNSISWRSETTPNPPEINPRLVFERLFGDFDSNLSPEERARRERYKKSILDFVSADARSLKMTLGPTDQRKLDEYLTAVRDIERRIEAAERARASGELADFTPAIAKPSGIPVEFAGHTKLMYDLLALAFEANLTRIATFMIGREGSNRTYREIGVPDAHHGISHHQGDEEKIEKLTRINIHHMELFAYFLDKLASIEDGDGSLLNHTMVIYGSGLSDGNRHDHHDLPVLVAGHGNGKVHPGRHLRYPTETPMTNLYVSILDGMGLDVEKFGDSTGELKELADI